MSLLGRDLLAQKAPSPEREANIANLLPSKTITIDPWRLGQKYPNQSASVGDSIYFKWTGTHGVYEIPSSSCPSDFKPSSSNGISVVQAAKASGTADYKFGKAGTYWFACPVNQGAHCNGGMLIKVVVF
jgi:hypothetical protein